MPLTAPMSGIAAGTVAYFAAGSAPAGWLSCNGASISRTTYAALFAAIGVTYGSVDGNNFNLPDLRGEFVRCLDGVRGVDPGRVIGSAQGHEILQGSVDVYSGQGADYGGFVAATGSMSLSNATAQSLNAWAGAAARYRTLSIGGGNETRPRNVAMLACIKY